MSIFTELNFTLGKYAFASGEPFNDQESYAWKQGWKSAQQEAGQ